MLFSFCVGKTFKLSFDIEHRTQSATKHFSLCRMNVDVAAPFENQIHGTISHLESTTNGKYDLKVVAMLRPSILNTIFSCFIFGFSKEQ